MTDGVRVQPKARDDAGFVNRVCPCTGRARYGKRREVTRGVPNESLENAGARGRVYVGPSNLAQRVGSDVRGVAARREDSKTAIGISYVDIRGRRAEGHANNLSGVVYSNC